MTKFPSDDSNRRVPVKNEKDFKGLRVYFTYLTLAVFYHMPIEDGPGALAKKLNVKSYRINNVLQSLRRDEYVAHDGKQWTLTQSGRDEYVAILGCKATSSLLDEWFGNPESSDYVPEDTEVENVEEEVPSVVADAFAQPPAPPLLVIYDKETLSEVISSMLPLAQEQKEEIDRLHRKVNDLQEELNRVSSQLRPSVGRKPVRGSQVANKTRIKVSNKDMQELIDHATKNGWVVEHTSGGHFQWKKINGEGLCHSGSTESDYRAVINTHSRLVNEGMPPHPKFKHVK